MPSVYQLLPPARRAALVDHNLQPLDADLHDVETWRRFRLGPFAPAPVRRLAELADGRDKVYPPFLEAALARARAFHARAGPRARHALPGRRSSILGGDCLPTLARAPGPPEARPPPRFEPLNRTEAEAMFEAGDGRVTRASVLGSHLPGADETRDRLRATRRSRTRSSAAPTTTASTASRTFQSMPAAARALRAAVRGVCALATAD